MSAEKLLTGLAANRRQAAKLDEQRDELVRELLLVEPKVPRKKIAEAAGVSEPRLYQIRDGR